MIINRSRRAPRPCPVIERQVVRIHDDGQPVAGLIVHGDNGTDVELLCRTIPDADALVDAAMAMRAALVVAVAANTITTKGGVA